MKYGIAIRNMGPQLTRGTILECARAAEHLGFDALFVSDHLCIPPDQTEGSGGRYLDVLTTLAYLAGATQKIRLGVSVLVLPYRPAVLTAKQIATIQELSGSRMILATGVGWMKPEFEALGANFARRGKAATETLEVLHHLFGKSAPAPYQGETVSFPAFVFEPHPARPPIWIGGNGAAARERVLRFGDGWHPMLKAAELKPLAASLKDNFRKQHGREMELIVRRGLRLDDLAKAGDAIEAERDAGATYFILDLGRYPDAAEFQRKAEIFMSRAAQ